jgi:hypothetical protein
MDLLEQAIGEHAPDLVAARSRGELRAALRDLSLNAEQGRAVWADDPPADVIARRLEITPESAEQIRQAARSSYESILNADNDTGIHRTRDQRADLRASILEEMLGKVPGLAAIKIPAELHAIAQDLRLTSTDEGKAMWVSDSPSPAEAIAARLGVSPDVAEAIGQSARDGFQSIAHATRDEVVEILRDRLAKKAVTQGGRRPGARCTGSWPTGSGLIPPGHVSLPMP